MIEEKKTIIYLDPTFPVTRYQAKFLGLEAIGIDLFDYRGSELIEEIKKHVSTGKIGGVLWSSPNNPSLSCLNDFELENIAKILSKMPKTPNFAQIGGISCILANNCSLRACNCGVQNLILVATRFEQASKTIETI